MSAFPWDGLGCANAQYELVPGCKLGLEVSNWKTEYLNPEAAQRNTRLQWSMQGSF